MIIELNGAQFAKGKSGLVDTLFIGKKTGDGYFRAFKRQIKFFAPNDELIAVITYHKVLACASKLESGENWFSCAAPKIIGKYESHQRECEEIEQALKACQIEPFRPAYLG